MTYQDYKEKISKAVTIKNQYLSIAPQIITKIGRSPNKHNPNHGLSAIQKNFIYSGGKLAGQIIASLDQGYIQLSMIGLRSLFEMSVNSVYIYANPTSPKNIREIRKICKEIIILSDKKRRPKHTLIDNKSLKQRLDDINMGYYYYKQYRIMSEWVHLSIKTSQLTVDQDYGKSLGVDIAANSLFSLHNIYDSVSSYNKMVIDADLERSVEEYRNS